MRTPGFPEKPQMFSISTMTFVKAVLIILGIWFLWFIRDIAAIFFVAVLLAALIDPFADWFAERHIPRAIGVVIVYVVLGVIILTVSVLLVPVVIEQGIALLSYLGVSPEIVSTWLQTVQDFFKQGSKVFVSLTSSPTLTSLGSLFATVKGFFGWIAALFIILVLAFYMVVEENSTRKFFRHVAPVEYQPYLGQLFTKMQKKVGAWLRGQIILGLIVGTAVYVGLSLLGVEYALLLAILAGFFEMVPYMGPVISVVPAAIIAFAQSPIKGALVLGLYLVIQQLENNLLVPKIMQKVTGLNPIVSIVALLVGIKVGGLAGALLSIPVATMAAVVLEDLFKDASSERLA